MEEKRCYGCMRIKSGSPFCEHCGYDDRTVTSVHHLRPGTVLRDKYMVGKVLGQGGFGITYIGLDLDLNIPVAIKEYYPVGVVMRESGDSPTVSVVTGGEDNRFEENRSRFLREAQILARLEDVPEVVQIKNYFAANNTAYIIMGYVQGITLKEYLQRKGGRLSAEECFRLLRPVMEAMDRVHALGLVHRDISPDNIMLQSNGRTRLIDFGAAHKASVDGERSTQAVLKHGFAPVEQYQSRGNLGPWTDVYAMCATVYYCLTGKMPPQATDRMMGEDAFDWNGIPGLTPAQKAVLRHGVEIHYQNRIQSMSQLCSGLFATAADPVMHANAATVQQSVGQQQGYQAHQQGYQAQQQVQYRNSRNNADQVRHQSAQTGNGKKPKSIMGTLVILAVILCAVIVIYTSFFMDNDSSLRNTGGGGTASHTASSKTVEVSTDMTGLSLNGKLSAKTGKDYTATLLANDGCHLPQEITVKVDGSKLSDKKYDYNPETGELTIPGDYVTGDIEIIAEAVVEAVPTDPNNLAFWEGDYYGWWIVNDIYEGDISEEGAWWDCFANVTFNRDGTAWVTVWDEDGSRSEPLGEIKMEITLVDYGVVEFNSISGGFGGCDVEYGQWYCRSDDHEDFDQIFWITATYNDGEGLHFDYTFFMRPWGHDWKDIAREAPNLLPGYYADWYLPLIESGVKKAPDFIN